MGKVCTSTFLLVVIYVVTVQPMVVNPNFKKFYDLLKPKFDRTTANVPETTSEMVKPGASTETLPPSSTITTTFYPSTSTGTVPGSSTTTTPTPGTSTGTVPASRSTTTPTPGTSTGTVPSFSTTLATPITTGTPDTTECTTHLDAMTIAAS